MTILDKATAIANQLFQRYGENQETLKDLSELAAITEQVRDLYTSLSTTPLTNSRSTTRSRPYYDEEAGANIANGAAQPGSICTRYR